MWNRISVNAFFFAVLMATAAAPTGAQSSSNSVDELEGLWKAQRTFTPTARGPLIIERQGATYVADMVGKRLNVRVDGAELVFQLPDDQGSFRGKLQSDGDILGHWRPPNSLSGFERIVPIVLRATSRTRWSGEVVLADDQFTFYLLARKRPDGTMTAFLRNPQRDIGTMMGVERLVREGATVKLMGKRRGQTQERELAVGTYSAEDSVLTLGFPSRGGSYDFRRESDESSFYPRGKAPARYAYAGAPLARDDGWSTATLDDVGIDRSAIETIVRKIIDTPMESGHSLQIDGILIARHGKLVLEEYFHDEHRDKLHESRSATKTVTATVIGAAIHAGAALSMSTPVYQIMNGGAFPAGLEPQKRGMTLEHLITMSSGYFCDDANPKAPGNESVMIDESGAQDFYEFTLKVPMATPPGEKAVYCSINPNLALGVVGRATGESPLYTFDRLVGGPLQIRRYAWPFDPVGHPYGGGGVHLLPRDFMKFGQLMLDGGVWHGKRILSADFVKRASAPLYPLGTMTYGYAWWGMDYPYKNRVVHAFAALGNGGQNVIVIPELDMVVAVYASNYGDRVMMEIQNDLVPKQILSAVSDVTKKP